MKILKPGKVEQRKFVCKKCGCEFVATAQEKYLAHDDYYQSWTEVQCPCGVAIKWDNGEPYEEPTPTQADRERLQAIIHNTYLSCDKINHHTAAELADELIAHGVTFREG